MMPSKYCPRCGAQAAADAAFCAGCGTRFMAAAPETEASICNQCQTPIPAGSRFCPDCGAPAAARAPAGGLEAEEASSASAPRRPRPAPEYSPPAPGAPGKSPLLAAAMLALALVVVALGFWLVRYARPQAPAVSSGAASAPSGGTKAAPVPVKHADAPPVKTASALPAKAAGAGDGLPAASIREEGDGVAAAPSPAADDDTAGAYAAPGSGLDDTPLSVDALQDESLTRDDLRGKSLRALSLSHNTIYALHGYVFERPSMRSYFASQSWYRPDPAFTDSMLTGTEQRNAQTIRAVERARFGYGRRAFDAQGRPAGRQRDPLRETAAPASGLSDGMLDLDSLQHRELTDDDLSDKSLAALSASYNEVYAAHGYVFKRRSLQDLFGRMRWYVPNPAFRESDLSDLERANLLTIRSYERRRFGY